MADENIDFRFLGRQVQKLQADVRDLRADHLRLEGDVAGLRADISRLEERMEGVEHRLDRVEHRLGTLDQKIDSHHRANQAQFEQVAQTAATNLQVMLAEFAKLEKK